jgi:signal transduction histidine kinase/ligand-binding sensor domain-containing protein
MLCLAGAASGAGPGRLPLRLFTTADGLASEDAGTIFSDSRGYLWIATNDGLSRFDGRRFVNYGTEDGLPHRAVGDIVEDRRGALWIATARGIARIDADAPAAAPFTRIDVDGDRTGALFIGRDGTVRASCGEGLCAFDGVRFRAEPSFRKAGGREVTSIAESATGELWVGTRHGLMQRANGGTWRHHVIHPALDLDDADITFDPEGRPWVTTPFETMVTTGFASFDERPLAEHVRARVLPGMTLSLPKEGEVVAITARHISPIIHNRRPVWTRDAVLIPAGIGLLRIVNGVVELLNDKQGLPRIGILSAGEDAAGNLWLGTEGFGVVRVMTRGAITLTMQEGLSDDRITSIIETNDALCVTDAAGFSCLQDGVFHNAPAHPKGTVNMGWGWNQVAVHDELGQWWVSGAELIQWPPVRRIEDLAHATPRIYGVRDIGVSEIFRLWQDSRRNIWIGGFGDVALSMRDPSGRFTLFPELPKNAPTAFAEDRAGNIWVGFYGGGTLGDDPGLFRYAHGRFERFTEGLPAGFVRELIVDSKGRLWMATAGRGVARIDDPTAPRIHARRYTHANGLASDVAYCLAETADHRIAIGSTRGLDLLDPETGHVAHLTTADGLPSNQILIARSDRSGTLWLGTLRGLARLPLLPSASPVAPPRPRITSLDINGVPSPLAELGVTDGRGFRVQYPQRRMTIGFDAPYFDPAHALRFQYRLAGDAHWTDAGAGRQAAYDRLPFGANAFEVRTVASDGRASATSRVAFDVATPLWLRPWFLALVLAVLIVAATLVHRARVAHFVALERLRMRVATDLHDDLGSSLSRISILSEVAKEKGNERLLDEIGDTARGLVDALSDSIWSVDPRRDNVQSLMSRVQHFAADLLEAKAMTLELRVPADLASIHLDAERRRELYLILKEALHNAAKHSDARRVIIAGELADGRLRIAVEDDGKGFALMPSTRGENGGHGVFNMNERAKRLGGTVSVASQPGAGTRISVAVPV